jgi:putative ABC transport system substrate-binding protein
MCFNVPSSKRTVFTLVLLVSFLVTACGGSPTDQAKSFTIGIVTESKPLAGVGESFKTGMTSLGYIEGKTVVYLDKGIITDPAGLETGMKSLVDAKVDLILTVGILPAQAAKKATAGTDLPVLFAPGGDPAALGLVQSISNPTGNLTGIATGYQYPGLALNYLTTIVPNAKRVFIMYDPALAAAPFIPSMKEAATKLGLEIILQEVHSNDDVTSALENMPANADAVFNLPDPWVNGRIADLVQATIKRKLPLLTTNATVVQAGALLSYSWDFAAVGKQAARLADRLLKGAKPSSLPIESPEFHLSINLQTAQAIGLTIPDDILRQAATIVR